MTVVRLRMSSEIWLAMLLVVKMMSASMLLTLPMSATVTVASMS